MIDLDPEIITTIMLCGVLVAVLCGIHLAVVLGFLALVCGFLIWGMEVADVIYMRVWSVLTNYVLLAVPLFVFMGVVIERSGISERMYEALFLWLGGFRGGLAIAAVVMGSILAACIGIVAASVTMLTLIALPAMIKRGYEKGLASGSVCAGGTLGILIPPSIMLVIYGPMAVISVGKLFFAAFIPGFVLTGLYISYIALRCLFQPKIAPAVPLEERVAVPFIKRTTKLLTAMAPTGLLIFGVLGTIFFGVAPPTEAAGVGACIAILLTIGYRKFSFEMLRESVLLTLRFCGFIILIAAMAFAFVGVFIASGGGKVVANLILASPGGQWGAFAVIMFICFILGMVIDWIGIVFIMVPIITPIGSTLGFDPLWFAMMVCINLQMSFLTPPFAFAIFIVKGAAAPELGITTGDIIRGVIPFIVLVMLGLGLCVAFPQLILWLPGLMVR